MSDLTPTPIFSPTELHAIINSSFDEASYDEQQAATQFARLLHLSQQAKRKADIAVIDVDAEMDAWLATKRSEFTKTTYRRAIAVWAEWLVSRQQHPLLVTVKDVDEFAAILKDDDIPPATARLYLSACSSFYSYLLRGGAVTHNHFYGVALPQINRLVKTVADIPVRSLIDAIAAYLRQRAETTEGRAAGLKRQGAKKLLPAILAMANDGLRIRALPTMQISGRICTVFTKGKRQIHELSQETLDSIVWSGLPFDRPFGRMTVSGIEKMVLRICTCMVAEGLLPKAYSPHDFRHYFAVTLFKQTKDLVLVSKRLGHRSPTTTMIYLSSYLDEETQRLLQQIAHT